MDDDRLQRLKRVVYEFAGLNPRLATPTGAFDRCTTAGQGLIEHLNASGFSAVPVRFNGARQSFPEAHGKWLRIRPEYWTHYAVLAEGIIIDVTACQFDPDADFPSFSEVQDAAAHWDDAMVLEGFGQNEIGPLMQVVEPTSVRRP